MYIWILNYFLMRKLILILCSLAAIAACDIQPGGNDYIEVEPSTELTFESEMSAAKLTVTSSGSWAAGELPDWIAVTPAEGEDGEQITVSVTENRLEDDRTGIFTLTSGTASATISVTQYGAIQTDYADLGLEDAGTSLTYCSDTGVLTVTYDGTTPPDVGAGQAVVLDAEHGYDIRVVESASVSGSTLSLQTAEGNMADLFKNTSFTLVTSGTTDTRSVDGRRIISPSEVGYFDTEGIYHKTYDRSDLTKGDLYQNGQELWSFHTDFNGATIAQGSAGRLYWETCSFDAGLNGEFTFDFGEKKIDEVRSKGDIKLFRYVLKGSLDMDLLLRYQYDAEYSEEEDEIIEKNVIRTISFKFLVGNVPVYITVDTHLGKSTEFSAEGHIDASAGVKLGTEVNMGVEWTKDAGARAIQEVNPYMTLHHPEFKAEASAEAKVSYYPHIDIRLYKFLGPWVEPRPYLKEAVEAGFRASTDGGSYIGWNAGTYAGLDLKMGLDLDFGIWEFNAWESEMYNPVEDQLLFEAPSRITLISPEDGTEVKSGETVTAKFLVESYSPLTGEYYPCPLALVNLEVDGGELGVPVAVSDLEGYAYAEWNPSASGTQSAQTRSESETLTRTMTAEVVDGTGETIDDATLIVKTEKERPTPGQWVDLGLPSGIKWAGWNVGATRPEEYGGYYAWGETEEKSEYSFETYKHRERTDYNHIHAGYWGYKELGNISGTSYDVATVRWGGGARMPTLEEITELYKYCYFEGGYLNNVAGNFVIGPNGNSIFIPFAGGRLSMGLDDEGDNAYYWSGTQYKDSLAYNLNCNWNYCNWNNVWSREGGLSVRPVSD